MNLNGEQFPAVTVVVPVYKVERYVERCLESILNQTFGDFELIIVEDASPDRSIEICERLAAADDRIKIIRHDRNRGLGAARNTGMEHARGKYIYFVDSDDMIFDNALEIYHRTAEANDADVVHCSSMVERFEDADGNFNDDDVKITGDKSSFNGWLPTERNDRLKRCYVDKLIWPMVWLNFYRREFLECRRIKFPCILSEDEPFAIALYCFAERFYCIPDCFYVYNRRFDSISKANNVERTIKGVSSLIDGCEYITQLFAQVPDELVSAQVKNDCVQAYLESMIQGYILCLYSSSDAIESVGAFDTLLRAVEKTSNARLMAHLLQGFSIQKSLNNLIAHSLMNENRQLRRTLDMMSVEYPPMVALVQALKSRAPKILLMSVPVHGNLGDQAITLGERVLLAKIFPKHKLIEVPSKYLTGRLNQIFATLKFERHIQPTDLIFIQGGGNLGTIWQAEEQVHKNIISQFPNNRVVIMPQSIYFDEINQAALTQESVEVYNAHRDLHLICRDKNSYAVAARLFPKVNRYLAPDSATALVDMWNCNKSRAGVLFVLRNDKEKFDHAALLDALNEHLQRRDIPIEQADTVIDVDVDEDNRFERVGKIVTRIGSARLVITDRYHGLIFAVITRTPVVVMRSFDTKITSGVKWFSEPGSVCCADECSLEEVIQFIDRHLASVNAKLNGSKCSARLIDVLKSISKSRVR